VAARKFLTIVSESGYKGWTAGATAFQVEPEPESESGAEAGSENESAAAAAATIFVGAIGWESVDAHIAFRDTATFKDNVALLRRGAKKIQMVHYRLCSF
jgi:hypothetical protein